MSDFEVVERGTVRELELARSLARSIEEVVKQYGQVVPYSVMQEYNKLKAYYESNDRTI